MRELKSEQPKLDSADLAACRALLANGSRTFFAASFLLPRRIRAPATALYAFCRLADDAVDSGGGSPGTLDALKERLDRAYAGRPLDCAADRAFAATVAEFGVPRALPEALIEGFEWDALGKRYETDTALEAYAARVAGTVGAMMALLMGATGHHQIARATDLGMAMQLTNIARDVGEDARAGRLYLPMQWLREVGLDPEQWLARPRFSPEIAAVVRRLLLLAESYYARAETGIARLPLDCRPGIYAARFLYAEIGHELARQGLNSVDRRAIVPAARKLQLLAYSSRSAWRAPRTDDSEIAPAAAFLVEAAASNAASRPRHDPSPADDTPVWWDFPARWARVIDLFHRLENHDRMNRTGGRLTAERVAVVNRRGN
ncbi:MAG: phytoene/squalene synthase family protein [Hyphomicrobium sp.]